MEFFTESFIEQCVPAVEERCQGLGAQAGGFHTRLLKCRFYHRSGVARPTAQEANALGETARQAPIPWGEGGLCHASHLGSSRVGREAEAVRGPHGQWSLLWLRWEWIRQGREWAPDRPV